MLHSTFFATMLRTQKALYINIDPFSIISFIMKYGQKCCVELCKTLKTHLRTHTQPHDPYYIKGYCALIHLIFFCCVFLFILVDSCVFFFCLRLFQCSLLLSCMLIQIQNNEIVMDFVNFRECIFYQKSVLVCKAV